MSALATRLQHIREEDFANISRTVHDELGQALMIGGEVIDGADSQVGHPAAYSAREVETWSAPVEEDEQEDRGRNQDDLPSTLQNMM